MFCFALPTKTERTYPNVQSDSGAMELRFFPVSQFSVPALETHQGFLNARHHAKLPSHLTVPSVGILFFCFKQTRMLSKERLLRSTVSPSWTKNPAPIQHLSLLSVEHPKCPLIRPLADGAQSQARSKSWMQGMCPGPLRDVQLGTQWKL